MIAGVFFCMNRSGWVGLALAIVIMGLFIRRFRKYFVALLVIGTIVGVTYWALITTSAVWRQRLQAQGPIDYRLQTWVVALNMIKDNPAFGIGYENFQFFYKRYAIWDIYLRAMPTPHNTYLWVILMGGMVAFIPFFAFLASLFLSALKLYLKPPAEEGFFPDRDLVVVFVASMISILAPAAVMDVMTGYYNTMIMFFIMGAFFGAVTGEYRQKDALWARARRILRERNQSLVKDSNVNTAEPTE
jgi:O-antigen ligase